VVAADAAPESVVTSGGATWQLSTNGFAAATITAIDSSPANPNVVYAAVQNNGLLKSTDGGSSWTSPGSADGFQNKGSPLMREFAVSPLESGRYRKISIRRRSRAS